MSKSQADLDNHANQLNPNNEAYQGSSGDYEPTQADLDNHSNQLNPNNETYSQSRAEEQPR